MLRSVVLPLEQVKGFLCNGENVCADMQEGFAIEVGIVIDLFVNSSLWLVLWVDMGLHTVGDRITEGSAK